MAAVKAHWQQWQTRFSALETREKTLVFATVVLTTLLAAWHFLVDPVLTAQAQVSRDQALVANELQALGMRQEELAGRLASDPATDLRQRQGQLEQRVARLDQQLEAMTTGLIGPEAMVALLQTLLQEHQGVRLMGVEHATPRPVTLDGRSATAGDEALDNDSQLFAHGVTVRISGEYLAILDYLVAMEALDSRLGWQTLDYQVTDWPRAEVQLRLQTLSLTKEWLGV
ncbi:MAG: hypothetical protein EA349_16695 [Halomonadaceae bacterium]|nr:MAG: hypothetical protein EA349_16695 [Halomonadaceae bacterium]